MKKIPAYVLFFLFLTFAYVPAFASSPWTNIEDYGDKASAKLGFGLRNALLGWTEIFTEGYESLWAKDDNIFFGVGRGIFKGTGRMGGGVFHAATFPLTSLDIPLPENGENLWPYS